MPDGCRCTQCWGLAEHMLEETGNDLGLPAAPGHARLRVVTAGSACHGYQNACVCPNCVARSGKTLHTFQGAISPEQPCDGSMTCTCTQCSQERRQRVVNASSDTRQPWQPRPARRAA